MAGYVLSARLQVVRRGYSGLQGHRRRHTSSGFTGPVSACLPVFPEDAGGMLAFALSRTTDLLNIVF